FCRTTIWALPPRVRRPFFLRRTVMAPGWHYQLDGKQIGPVSPEEMKALAAAGKLKPTDLIWNPSMMNWVPASTWKDLFPEAETSATSSQGNHLFQKVKTKWQATSTGAKVGIFAGLVGGSAVLVLVLCVLPLIWILGRASGSGSSQGKGSDKSA